VVSSDCAVTHVFELDQTWVGCLRVWVGCRRGKRVEGGRCDRPLQKLPGRVVKVFVECSVVPHSRDRIFASVEGHVDGPHL